MDKISKSIIKLLSRGIYSEAYNTEELILAVNTIADNDIDELITTYQNSRHNSSSSAVHVDYSNKCGCIMLRVIMKDDNTLEKLLNNLPHIYSISLQEFEIIINATFERMPECKIHLIKFILPWEGKVKISMSNFSKEIKNELESIIVMNKLAPQNT